MDVTIPENWKKGKASTERVLVLNRKYPATESLTWNYSANGATLTAICENDESRTASLTLTAPELTYTGSAQGISDNDISNLSEFNTATGLTISSNDIKYWTEYNDAAKTATSAENSGAAATNASPVNAGTYYATLTVSDKTAVISFSIGKVAPVAGAEPTAVPGLVYDENEHELVTAGSTSDGVYMYSLTGGDDYSADIPKAKNAGTYNIYYKIAGDDNHLDKVFETPVSVNISKAEYTGIKTVSQNILAVAASSSEVELPSIPENMTYGIADFLAPIIKAYVEDGKVKFTSDEGITVDGLYTITIPVEAEDDKCANYNDYNITVSLKGITCSHVTRVNVPEVAATCTKDGYKAYDSCSVCGSKLIGTEVKLDDDLRIEKTGHDLKSKSAGNVMTIFCDRCSESKSITVSATSPETAGNASVVTIGTEAERAALDEIGCSVSNNKVEHYRGSSRLSAAPTTEGRYTVKVTVSTNGVVATAETKYSIGDAAKYATDYDDIYTKLINEKKASKGVTLESADGIVTVNSKLKITMPASHWSAKAYTKERVTPENITTVQWSEDSKTLKKLASVKYNKKKNQTFVTTKQNKKIPGGVYAVRLENEKGNTIYLNIECIELNKTIKKTSIYTKPEGSVISANDILSALDGENAKTVALTMLGSDNKTKSQFGKNVVKWTAGKGKKAAAISEGEVLEYKTKKGKVIAYLTLDNDGNVKILAGTAKGSISLKALVNGKAYTTSIVVKEKK